MVEHTGWLLDLHAHSSEGVVLWLLGDDGFRHRLHQPFPVTFYAGGPSHRLRELWGYLQSQPIPLSLARVESRELFHKRLIPVLAIRVDQAALQPRLFKLTAKRFPELNYYNADIPLILRYAAKHGTFPLARCIVQADSQGRIYGMDVLESPWDLDTEPPSLRILYLKPDCDPHHETPTRLISHFENVDYCFPLAPSRPLLVHVAALLHRHDPDLILTAWGDSWLLPQLLKLDRDWNIHLPLNREARHDVIRRPQRTYFSYGQVIYRGPQVRLFGRWHIDACNAVMFRDYGLEGVLEMSRVTGLSVQRAARVSPGTGISAMQITTALRQKILVPWHKQQAERSKTARQLLNADKGGLVYQPLTGLHQNVAEIDFISMYPSIMVHFNVSPETVGEHCPNASWIPELKLPITQEQIGLVPKTLKPLLEKRIQLKSRMSELHPNDIFYKRYKAQASAHKWLLVTCFGYLGYKNARFGRIEAHEAVTAYGREALLRAKEAAEDLGYTVLHMYVDGLWVRKETCSTAADLEPLLNEIIRRTRLPVSLAGIYRWIAFLPSRIDDRVPVANRYFGAFQNGDLKLRGIEVRRKDTPPFIARTQMDALRLMTRAPNIEYLSKCLPELISLFQKRLEDLRTGRIPLPQLLVSQKLSRNLDEYSVPSPVARAVAQLQQVGKSARPGQRVKFIFTRGEPGVHAWDLPHPPPPDAVDTKHYANLFLRAVSTVLQPLEIQERTLRDWLFSKAGYGGCPGVVLSDFCYDVPLLSRV